jgi:hypothetical protein
MPKRRSQERDKRSRDRQNELQQKKTSRNTKKSSGAGVCYQFANEQQVQSKAFASNF